MSELKQDLEAMLTSDGWRWFVDRVSKDWGPNGNRFSSELKSALNLTDNNAAASQARQIVSAQATIMAMLQLPQEELAKLKLQERTPIQSRPPMEDALVGQSRRGSL